MDDKTNDGEPVKPALMSHIPAQSESSALIAMIERAARDPSVDIDKMERLLARRDAIRRQEAEVAFDEAMAAAQQEMHTVVKDKVNPQTRSGYASYDAIDRMLRPVYSKHGLFPSFNTAPGPDATMLLITCRVSKSGFGRDYSIPMPADGMGAKGGAVMTRTHATGSAITYGRRYLLLMIFNVVVGDERDDDDGNAAGTKGSDNAISEDQATTLANAITSTGGDVGKFCKFMQIDTLAELPASRYEAAMAAVQRAAAARKREKKGAGNGD